MAGDARVADSRPPWGGLDRRDSFFENAETLALLDRAHLYARAGVCVHFSGPAGLGKTSLALRLAAALGRPVVFIAGNDWLTSRDLIGHEVGHSVSTLVDNYVHTVRRTEAETRADWRDSPLASAMLNGGTVVYDEFTRSSPEANSILLSVIEEGVLVSTDPASPRSYILAHPRFRMILTSNPHEYVGVKGAPDALMDRVVTLPLKSPSADTMAGIVAMRTGLSDVQSQRVVALASGLTGSEGQEPSSLRSALMIGRIAAFKSAESCLTDQALLEIAADVLGGRGHAVSVGALSAALQTNKVA